MILQIKALLAQRRKLDGKPRSASQCRSEVKLLFNEAVNHLTTIIDQTADDDFPLRYHNVVNLRHNRAHYYNHIDLLDTLSSPKQSLVIVQPGKRDDVIWTSGEKEVSAWLNGFWPFPVDASKLVVPPHKRHFQLTSEEVLTWTVSPSWCPTAMFKHLCVILEKQAEV